MSPKNILLTGGLGFIGTYVKNCIAHQHNVFCLTRTNLEEVKSFGPELVINLAWEGVFGHTRNDLELQKKNIPFNEKLFAVCLPSCKRWVGVGSQMEINRPDVPYAYYKNNVRVKIDSLCKEHNISFAWIRIFSTYGPGDNPNNFIPYLIRELKAGKDPELTDQNIPWDYLYVKDMAQGIATVALSDATGIFELGSGQPVMTQDVAKLIRDKINPQAVLQFGKRPKREIELNYLCANISQLTEIGWCPRTSLDDGLNETILLQQ